VVIKRILVPVDFSDRSLQALDYAAELGRRFGAALTVLHVVEPVSPAPLAYGPMDDAGALLQELLRMGRRELERVAAKLRKRRVSSATVLRVGVPYTEITGTAKRSRADLIVMSTHGRTGLARALLGSVAENVVRTAMCPVLTVRDSKPRPAARTPRRRARRSVPT
jgi:nucleotide-binding universal stress UspA family protein